MADNKRRGRFGKGSQEDANQSIFDLFEPPPDQDDTTSFGKIPVIRDEESLDLTDTAFVESEASAQAEAAGLAHWTEPATGQIPASLGSDRAGTEVKGPSWQGEDPNWEGADLADVFADTDAITHDRIIDLDDDEFLAEAPPPPPRPTRPAPTRAPAVSERVPPAPPVREQPAGPSVFDTPGGSGPLTAVGDAQAAAGGHSPRRQVAEAAPSPAQPRPAAAAPPPPAAAAPRRVTGEHLAPGSTAPPARTDIPPPNRQPASPPANGNGNGHRDRPPEPPGPQAAGRSPVRERPVNAPPPPAVGGVATPESAASRGRRGAHDLPPEPPTASADPQLLGVEFAGPAATGQLPSVPGPVQEIASGGRHHDFDPGRLDPRGALGNQIEHEHEDDDYDEYDDAYDDYDDEGGGRSLGQSVLVGIALAAVVFVTLGFGPIPTMVLIGILTFVAVMELFNAMRLAGLRPATLLGLVGATALPAASYVRGDAGFPLVMGLAVVFGMLWYLTGADTERPVLNLGLTFMGILWIGALASFGALMIRAEDGVGLLLATIIVTAASDTFAYLGGRAYGTKPFHSASPNKTWEGTITGFVGAMLAGTAIGVTNLIGVFDGQFVSVVVLAAVVGLLAPIGDLAESLVKRDLGVKDMGTLLPGHGGILDRVDGLLFALPGAYYVAVVYTLI